MEVRRKHADDHVVSASGGEPATQHPWVFAESPLPKAVAEQRHLVFAGDTFIGRERTPELRRSSQERQEPGGDFRGLYLFGTVAARQIHPPNVHRLQIGKGGRLELPFGEIAARDGQPFR